MKDAPVKAAVRAQNLAQILRTRLETARDEMAGRGDRGDGPIPTVIILLATIAGAATIAIALGALYAKYGARVLGG